MKTKPEKQEISRNPDGTFPAGVSGNPKGRPVGKTLKEYVRSKFFEMTDEQRDAFLKSISPDLWWKMAEGNPHNTNDVTSGGKPLPILGGYEIPSNNSNEQDTGAEEEN